MPEEAPVMSTTFPLRSSFLSGFTNAHTNSFTGIERGMYTKIDDNRRRDVHQHAVKKKIEIHDQSSRGDGAAGGIRSVSSPALLGNKRVGSRCEIDPECLVQLG